MPSEEHNFRNIGNEHTRPKDGLNLPDFNFQNIIIFAFVLAVLGIALYVFKPSLFKGLKIGIDSKTAASRQEQKKEVKSSGYSAVFLTNNQVYFGRLEDANSNYPRLKEVYYLRANSPLQPQTATRSAQSDVSLIKLGEELHGPSDEIKFNRDQILYIEDLKSDSRVVKAIEEYKAKKK